MTNRTEKEFISIKEASILTGIQAQTLRKLGDQQKIQCYKTISGQRKFHKASLEAMCYSGGATAASSNFVNKQNFIYARVSCNRLVKDLQKQIDEIVASDEKYRNYTQITDISTGTNFKRKGLQTILKACFQKNVGEVVITRVDRLCIVGYDLVENIITSCGGRIVILNEDINGMDNNVITEVIDILQNFSRCSSRGGDAVTEDTASKLDDITNTVSGIA